MLYLRIPYLNSGWLYMLEEEFKVYKDLTVYPGKTKMYAAIHTEAGIVWDCRLFPTWEEARQYQESTFNGMNAELSEETQYKNIQEYNENSDGVLTIEEALIGYPKGVK